MQKFRKAQLHTVQPGAVMIHQHNLERKQQRAEQQHPFAAGQGQGIVPRQAQQVKSRQADAGADSQFDPRPPPKEHPQQRYQHHIQRRQKPALAVLVVPMPICCAAEAANSAMPQNAPPRSSIRPLIQNGTPGSALRALPRRSKTSTIKMRRPASCGPPKRYTAPHSRCPHFAPQRLCPRSAPPAEAAGCCAAVFIKVHL